MQARTDREGFEVEGIVNGQMSIKPWVAGQRNRVEDGGNRVAFGQGRLRHCQAFVGFENSDVDDTLRPDVHHRLGGHQSFLAAGQDPPEFGLRHIGQEGVIFCSVDASPRDKFTAAVAKGNQGVAFDSNCLGSKYEFEFDPDHTAEVGVFSGEGLNILR
jgi:hypothetical protein